MARKTFGFSCIYLWRYACMLAWTRGFLFYPASYNPFLSLFILMLKLSKIWPVESCALLAFLVVLWALSYLCHNEMFQALLIFSLPQLWNQSTVQESLVSFGGCKVCLLLPGIMPMPSPFIKNILWCYLCYPEMRHNQPTHSLKTK